ncbi:MAG TPA: response regulator [Candidatus Omnitrophota bacterium]|nr:response regulator [Candidatus Omnitrophota bacterium]HPD84414.1 response regulator [Candidatus Omnitrophota bacterium]HRZ03272.1 response regulator [Candidatus Omnitrophota bacterium]
MVRRSLDLTVVGFGLSIAYVVGLIAALAGLFLSIFNQGAFLQSPMFIGQYRSIAEFQQYTAVLWFLYFLQLIGLVAVLDLREWGRKLVIAANAAMCVYTILRAVLLSQGMDFFQLLSLFIYALVIFFFIQPKIKEQFQKALARAPRNGKTILVIDDEKGLLVMAKNALSWKGFRVLLAETGEKGIAVSRRKKPDLIVLDVILPGIKGREVCARLKKDPQTKDIPVIFLTSKDSPDDIKAELEAGGVSHLPKPFDAEKLSAEINRVLGL